MPTLVNAARLRHRLDYDSEVRRIKYVSSCGTESVQAPRVVNNNNNYPPYYDGNTLIIADTLDPVTLLGATYVHTQYIYHPMCVRDRYNRYVHVMHVYV